MFDALKYLGRISDALFDAQMQRVAQRISATALLFSHR